MIGLKSQFQLNSGTAVDCTGDKPQLPEILSWGDLVLGLDRLPRFLGQSHTRWSVLQHSCLVADAMGRDSEHAPLAIYGLLHDAHEIFTGDVPSPIKKYLPGLAELEDHLQTQLYDRLEIPTPDTATKQIVKMYDLGALYVEARQFARQAAPWVDCCDAIKAQIPAYVIESCTVALGGFFCPSYFLQQLVRLKKCVQN